MHRATPEQSPSFDVLTPFLIVLDRKFSVLDVVSTAFFFLKFSSGPSVVRRRDAVKTARKTALFSGLTKGWPFIVPPAEPGVPGGKREVHTGGIRWISEPHH